MGKQEGIVENYLKAKAKQNGFMCLKFTSPSYSGVPDRLLIGHGSVFFVETKAPGKTTRILQDEVIKQMTEHGAIIYVADTKDKIDCIFRSMGYI